MNTASQWTAPALASAIAILVGAVCLGAVQLARTYAQVINILEGLHRVGIPMRGAHSAPDSAPPAATSLLASGARAQQPLNTANWSQLTDLQMKGSAAGAAAVDCGEECAAIICQHIKHVPVPAEYIRWLWRGRFDRSLTSPEDLVGMLACVDIKAHTRAVAAAIAQSEMCTAFADGRLTAALGAWVSPDVQHWIVIVQATDSGLMARDPWTGTLRAFTWARFQALYGGGYVHIDQYPDTDRLAAL